MALSNAPGYLQLGPLFPTDYLGMMHEGIHNSSCVPDSLSFPESGLQECAKKLTSSKPQCPAIPTVAIFFACIAQRLNLANGTSFDSKPVQALLDSLSSSSGWRAFERNVSSLCEAFAQPHMTADQHAVYYLSCITWENVITCDMLRPSEAGKCRRAKFLAGTCPLSPRTLLGAFSSQQQLADKWFSCGGNQTISVNSPTCGSHEDAMMNVMSCVLEDFTDDAGAIDFDKVRASINPDVVPNPSNNTFLQLAQSCSTSLHTVKGFVDCWTRVGILTCAPSEATQLAFRYQPC